MPNYIETDAAARLLASSRKVLVIGCSGGGKTTLSRKIAQAFDLPYVSIDRDVRWLPGWQVRDREEQRALIRRLCRADRWVMDGSGASTFDLRLPHADLVLWVRVPRRVALWGLAKRVARNYGRVRFGMAKGCPERLPDLEFLSYIWNFERRYTPRFIEEIDRHGPRVPVAVLRSRRDMDALHDTPSRNPKS